MKSVGAMILAVGSVVVAYIVGVNTGEAPGASYGYHIVFTIVLGMALCGLYLMGLHVEGDVSSTLKYQEVYEVVGEPAQNEGKYLVFLKDRKGNVKAYKLTDVPPQCFQVVKDGNKKTYESFPVPQETPA
ncbi:hypothetical protein MYX06_04495 [Patescibacteria group bacterium AH-259-L05]|nr:hypothetical protein [Patescibacteria group bacterium AH-259-L05]